MMSGHIDEVRTKPRHIAIIMDGNGRWAEARGLPRAEGHRRGVEAVRETIAGAIEQDIDHLTIFSFSSENWSRPAAEINVLMGLLRRFIQRDLAELHQSNVRIRVIGERQGVDADIVKLLADAEELTARNDGLKLTVAFNYGGRGEIARAARRLAEQVERGELSAGAIDTETFAGALDTAGLPDPDLFIRTSGELRVSNFLLWQIAYAELVFLDVCWPDFTREHLAGAIAEYQSRDRRFGGLSARSRATGPARP